MDRLIQPMEPLDVVQFWQDDEAAHRDNCFFNSGQTAFGIRMSPACVTAELGEPEGSLSPEDPVRYLDLLRRYNDKAEQVVGRRLLEETVTPADAAFPAVKRIGEVFGGEYVIRRQKERLDQCFEDEDELKKKLHKVRRMDIRSFMLPDCWESEKKRIYETYGIRPKPLRWLRGPVTLACALFGNENLTYMILNNPELAKEFSDTITYVILEMARVMDEEAGVTPETEPGFHFADDACCVLTPEMYTLFGYPVLRDVFARYSPNPGDGRYQHSDSPMGHLLPVLGQLDLNGCNFGPTVMAPEIRRHLPHARIDGCIAPYTFADGDRETLIRETVRDCRADEVCGGVNITTAGAIGSGSSLESMRLMMQVIQNCRHHSS